MTAETTYVRFYPISEPEEDWEYCAPDDPHAIEMRELAVIHACGHQDHYWWLADASPPEIDALQVCHNCRPRPCCGRRWSDPGGCPECDPFMAEEER